MLRSILVVTWRLHDCKKCVIVAVLIFNQFTPMYLLKNLENALV